MKSRNIILQDKIIHFQVDMLHHEIQEHHFTGQDYSLSGRYVASWNPGTSFYRTRSFTSREMCCIMKSRNIILQHKIIHFQVDMLHHEIQEHHFTGQDYSLPGRYVASWNPGTSSHRTRLVTSREICCIMKSRNIILQHKIIHFQGRYVASWNPGTSFYRTRLFTSR